MKRISLLYTWSGGGHLSLALAVREALQKYYRYQYEFALFDPFPPLYSSVYKHLSSQFQNVWKFSYQMSDNQSLSQIISYINRLPVSSNLIKHLQSYKPDLVISNNAPINTALPKVFSRLPHPPKCVIHFADPISLHQLWLTNKQADLYLSPTSQATESAIKGGISPEKVKTVGWITRSEFLEKPQDKKHLRLILGLDPKKFTIFVGGAGQGGGKINQLVTQITHSTYLKDSAQVIVNTGLNTELVEEIMHLVERHPNFIHLIPYAHNMPQLLTASDIVVGKAGPNFLFESVHMLRPIIAAGCLDGQEAGNLDLISDEHIGWIENNLASAVYLIEELARHPHLISTKLPHLRSLKKQHQDTPRRIASEIHHLLTQRK